MKIAIICSHGGHLTEINYIIHSLKDHDYFYITYDSERTRELENKKYLFPNFGKNPKLMLKYIFKFIKILKYEKPDLIISTGAEIAIPFFYIAKIFKIKTIFIETVTRVNNPTITGLLVYPITDFFIVYWEELLGCYGRKAKYYGPLLLKGEKIIKKFDSKLNIFCIVGMHYLDFSRLLIKIDEIGFAHRSYNIIAQTGNSNYTPKNVGHFQYLKKDEDIISIINASDIIICQGGSSIIDGILRGKIVISVPRSKEYNEHMNDHQKIFSDKMKTLGFINCVHNVDELEDVILNINNDNYYAARVNPDINRNIEYIISNINQ